MKKMLFVYNPRAGKGTIKEALSDILEEFAQHDMQMTVHPTTCRGDARRVVREEGGQYDLIVCSGGDGTLDEVTAGLMEGGLRVPIGYIPAGSTNDFANSLGIPTQMRRAAADIADGEVFACDVGKLEDRHFIYVAAFGAFTEVSYKTDQAMKNMLGHLAYLLEGVKSLTTLHAWKLSYESKEKSGSGSYLYGMITNSNSVGGFKGITGNDVTLNDGVFEVTLIEEADLFEYPAMINALVQGIENEHIITFKTDKLTIVSEEDVPWTTDGEYGGTYKTCVVENIPRALPIMLGKHEEEGTEADPYEEDAEDFDNHIG